jgi:anti-sigma B factor antagonist
MNENEKINITRRENIGIIKFLSSCINDSESIVAAGKKIKDFIDSDKPARLIFDFEDVKFFSSQVLGLLLEVRAMLNDKNGELVISSINPQLHRVFRITNLDKIFRFFPDVDSAVKTESIK